jgi:hypothetical protein
MKKGWPILVSSLLVAAIAIIGGCGDGKSGTLTVADITKTDLSGGIYNVETSATFTPASGSALPNTLISYTATFAGSTTLTRTGTSLQSGGKAGIGPWQITQGTVPIIVTISATYEGLSATKVTSIPAISPLTVTPQAVAFTNTDTAGTTLTVEVAGGFSPYTVSSLNSADIAASVSGGTVTITKLTASGLTNTSTTVTVTDNKGNQQAVTVGYYR